MFARLRNNFEYKLLSLVFACALHYYVVAQKSPHLPKQLTIPLSVENVPPDLIFDNTDTPSETLTLDGPSDMLDRLNENNVTAEADLGRSHLGSNRDLKVHVVLPASMRNDITVLTTVPSSVTVVLKAKVSRSLEITATPPKTPPAGYIYRTPVVSPNTATFTGPQAAVDSVQHLVVKSVGDGAAGTVDGDEDIVPLDADGNPVADVNLSPNTAHVRIGIASAPAMKALLVSPNILNSPPFPYKIADITVKPQSVIVSGRPERLSAVGTLTTEPLDVSGLTSDVTRQVRCIAPPDTTLDGSPTIAVTVHIITQQPMVGPAPVPPKP